MNWISARCSRASAAAHHREAGARDARPPPRNRAARAASPRSTWSSGLKSNVARRAPAAHLDVGGLVAAVRHGVVQQVGQAELQRHRSFRLHGVELGFGAVERGTELLDLGQQRRDVLRPVPWPCRSLLDLTLRSLRSSLDLDLQPPCAVSSSAQIARRCRARSRAAPGCAPTRSGSDRSRRGSSMCSSLRRCDWQGVRRELSKLRKPPWLRARSLVRRAARFRSRSAAELLGDLDLQAARSRGS